MSETLSDHHRTNSSFPRRLLLALVLIAYGIVMIKIMVFKDVPPIHIGVVTLDFGGTNASNPANFVPFKTILPYVLGEKGFIIGGLNLIGNIALLVPIGLLLPLVFPTITWKKTFITAVVSGLTIETSQVVLRVGIFDIDDVILNALGLLIGYGSYIAFNRWVRSTRSRILIGVVIFSIAAGAVLYAVRDVQSSQKPTRLKLPADTTQSELSGNEDSESSTGVDLCGGTGGNGKVVSVAENTINFMRKDEADLLIHITDQTIVETSAGLASVADLKAGDRLTLIGDMNPDGSFTAQTLVVCETEK